MKEKCSIVFGFREGPNIWNRQNWKTRKLQITGEEFEERARLKLPLNSGVNMEFRWQIVEFKRI